MKKLGINIDHVATLRNVRKGTYPDPIEFARLCQLAGVDNITFHLREDRRHIQDADVRLLQTSMQVALNFEMACTAEMVELALEIKPATVTFVPEKREELTTEGGLNLQYQTSELQKATDLLLENGMSVSYFIEPELDAINTAKKMGVNAIEIHTGDYANRFTDGPDEEVLAKIMQASDHAFELGLEVHAGHGLNLLNLMPLVAVETIHSFQIGHAIVSDALFYGVDQTIKRYRKTLNP
ncbi:MAG: pyridoxine 5'-phosphate synthase [Deltaproteobacteria bacterium]|nr:pyridoxine 5'-phosphate synthase [Deltaproteobacteria bacterium]